MSEKSQAVTASATHLFPRHFEKSVEINTPAEAIFAHLDDHRHLSAHMSQSSWMMAGSRMEFEFDASRGTAVGSKIGLRGRILGVPLSVDEVVTERTPAVRKVWETIGTPKLLVIGPYRMGFEITPKGEAARLRVFIDYALPERPLRWLGQMFGDAYARWCTTTMVGDAAKHFGAGASQARPGPQW